MNPVLVKLKGSRAEEKYLYTFMKTEHEYVWGRGGRGRGQLSYCCCLDPMLLLTSTKVG